MEELEEPVTVNDLKFLAILCLLSMKELGHLNISHYGLWEIAFGDECQEKGLVGGTLLIDGIKVILINPTAKKTDILSTIAHEVVHLAQFMKGDAETGQGIGELLGKGETHKILTGAHEIHGEYDAQPWEQEAFRLAPQIVANLRTVPINQIAPIWLSNDASQWALDLFTSDTP